MESGKNSREQLIKHEGMDLTQGSIPRNLIIFGLPMLAGSVMQTLYSLINAFWVGRYLGTNALAAVTVSFPAIFVLIAVGAGLTLGSNILIAQYVGAREFEKVKDVVQTSVLMVAGLVVIFLALGLSFSGPLLRLMRTPLEVYPFALRYINIYYWTLPFGFALFLMSAFLRGIGDSRTPLYFQAVAIGINTVLDPLLMFGLLHLPRLGLNGTAYASIIAQAFAAAGLWIYIPRRRALVSPEWRYLRMTLHTAWLLVRVGLPSMVQQSVVSVSLLFIVAFVSAFGANADAGFGAALRIDQIAFLPALTIGMAVSTLSGQNIGAYKYERVRAVFRWGLVISGGISLAISVTVMAFPQIILRAFLRDPAVVQIGVQYLRIVGITYTLYAVLFVSNGVINGAGHTFPTTVITVINLWGVRVPLAWLLPGYFHGVKGIWVAMTVSVATGMALSLAYYGLGRWKKPVIGQKPRTAGP